MGTIRSTFETSPSENFIQQKILDAFFLYSFHLKIFIIPICRLKTVEMKNQDIPGFIRVLRKMEVEQTRNHIFPSFTNLAITNRIKRNHQAGLDLRFNP